MSEFVPVDHKDSDDIYRASVWESVAHEVGESIRPIESQSEILGDWTEVQIRDRLKRESRKYTPTIQIRYFADGISERGYSISIGRLEVEFVDQHCAISQSGKLLIFNGDASLLYVGQRAPTATD